MSATARLWVIEWKRKGVREAWRKWAVAPTRRSANMTKKRALLHHATREFRVVEYRRVTP